MINNDIRNYITQKNPNVIILDNPSYDNSIIGLDENDRIVYDYDKMISELVKDEGMSTTDAIEFCEYNTLRAIPYIGRNIRPIVIFYTDSIKELRHDSDS